MARYAINEDYLYAEIQDCMEDSSEWSKYSEFLKLENKVYGYVFNSTMTDMTFAIVSDNAADVEGIKESDVENWLQQVQNDETEYNSYNGLPVETDENGSLEIHDDMLVFDKSLDEIINEIQSQNGRMSAGDMERKIIADYATREKTLMCLDGGASYPNSEVIPVAYDSWSF